ncbi:hypothetical protein P8X24_02670 [Pyrococcus kukulkanii]|uniref:hypothetical protein n=1 Tax=Pyrococcus kukulkanii TaxID=1609559 RepID=UPI0035678115
MQSREEQLPLEFWSGGSNKIHKEALRKSRKELGDEWAEKFISLEKLMNEFEVILIATGAWRSRILKTPGHDFSGLMDVLGALAKIKMARIGYLPKSELPDFENK